MQPIFGDSTPAPERLDEAVRIVFRTEHFQLKWSHCSATADFLSGLYSSALAPNRTRAQLADLGHGIAYLVNELVENATKYRAAGDVVIEAGLHAGDFVLRIENSITEQIGARFQALLVEITAGDPGDLLIQRIEANAEGGSGSGLGLLTLMSDYGVRLSWRFRLAGAEPGIVLLQTIARLPIPAASQTSLSPLSNTHRHGN